MAVSKPPDTAERLAAYGVFHEAVIEAVSDAACAESDLSFREVADKYDLADGPRHFIYPDRSHLTGEYLRIDPVTDYDPAVVRLAFTPITTPVDKNSAMRMMRQFAADPAQPLIYVGNAAQPGNLHNRVSLPGALKVASGDWLPLARPALQFLARQGVQKVTLQGYSSGAHTATWAAIGAPEADLTVDRLIPVEPTAVIARGVSRLLHDFQASGTTVERYVSSVDSKAYREARATMTPSFLGRMALLRATNLAKAANLLYPRFEGWLQQAVETNPEMPVTVVWGTKSEMADDAALHAIVDRVSINDLAIPGAHHAFGDDIDLHAAAILQAKLL